MFSSILTRKPISQPLNWSTLIIYWITLSVLFTGSSYGDSSSEDAAIEESLSNILRHLFPMVPDKSRTPLRDNSLGIQLLFNNPHHHHLSNPLSSSSDSIFTSLTNYQGGEGDIDSGGGSDGGAGVEGGVDVNGFNSDTRGLPTDDLITTNSQHHINPNHHHHRDPFLTSSTRNIGIESRSHPYNTRDLSSSSSSSSSSPPSSSSINNFIRNLIASEEARESAMAATYSDLNLADFSSNLPFKSSSSSSKPDNKETEALLSSSSSSSSSPSSSSSSSSLLPSDIKIITSRTPIGSTGRRVVSSNQVIRPSTILPSSTSIQNEQQQQLAIPRKPRVIGNNHGLSCMKRCISQKILHPVQCHSLC